MIENFLQQHIILPVDCAHYNLGLQAIGGQMAFLHLFWAILQMIVHKHFGRNLKNIPTGFHTARKITLQQKVRNITS